MSLLAGQSGTLDINNNSVKIEGTKADGQEGDYHIRFTEASDYETYHDIILDSSNGINDTTLTKTDAGIEILGNADSEFTISSEDNGKENA